MKTLNKIICAAAAMALCMAMTGCAASDSVKQSIDSAAEQRADDVMRTAVSMDNEALVVYSAFRNAVTDLQAADLDCDLSVIAGVHVFSVSELNSAQCPPSKATADEMLQYMLYRIHESYPDLGGKKTQIAVKFDSTGTVAAAAVTDDVNYGTCPNSMTDGQTFNNINEAINYAG